MVELNVTVTDVIEQEHSMANLVQIACKYESRIKIKNGDHMMNAKSIIGMMSLNPQKGSVVYISAEGPDEERAAAEIAAYLGQSL